MKQVPLLLFVLAAPLVMAGPSIGDTTADGTVDLRDLLLILTDKTAGYTARSDLNTDGLINIFDLVLVGNRYGTTYPSAAVTDLAASATSNSVTVRFTQVDDGTGRPAYYRVKYAPQPLAWSSATTGCSQLQGTTIGASMTCTITGLQPGTPYEFQLMSHRLVNGAWVGAVYSNVAAATLNTPTNALTDGIWVSKSELATIPTSGPAWDELLADAARDPGIADIANQDSHHDVYTLAAAIVCARTGQYCAKARQGVLDAIGTEGNTRWLAVGRNLGGYVIAADLLDLRADGNPASDGTRVQAWMQLWMSRELPENNDPTQLRQIAPFRAGANAAAEEGFVYTALAAYLGDAAALERAWDAYRTYACEPGAPDRENINLRQPINHDWTHDVDAPCAVNPAGTVKTVPQGLPGAGNTYRLDGSIGGDMWRGGDYQWPPLYTQYPWVGLEGFVPAAVILERAGYPAFEVADHAVLRTHDYLWYLRTQTGEVRWFDGDRAREVVHLVNWRYGSTFPVNGPAGRGRTFGYTDWTHPAP